MSYVDVRDASVIGGAGGAGHDGAAGGTGAAVAIANAIDISNAPGASVGDFATGGAGGAGTPGGAGGSASDTATWTNLTADAAYSATASPEPGPRSPAALAATRPARRSSAPPPARPRLR